MPKLLKRAVAAKIRRMCILCIPFARPRSGPRRKDANVISFGRNRSSTGWLIILYFTSKLGWCKGTIIMGPGFGGEFRRVVEHLPDSRTSKEIALMDDMALMQRLGSLIQQWSHCSIKDQPKHCHPVRSASPENEHVLADVATCLSVLFVCHGPIV